MERPPGAMPGGRVAYGAPAPSARRRPRARSGFRSAGPSVTFVTASRVPPDNGTQPFGDDDAIEIGRPAGAGVPGVPGRDGVRPGRRPQPLARGSRRQEGPRMGQGAQREGYRRTRGGARVRTHPRAPAGDLQRPRAHSRRELRGRLVLQPLAGRRRTSAACGAAPRWTSTARPARSGRPCSTSTRWPPPRRRTGSGRAPNASAPTTAAA
jgi:hypothetical protein